MTMSIKCPRCGNPMVKKVRKKTGQEYYGCSLYPDCFGMIIPSGEGAAPTVRYFNPDNIKRKENEDVN